MSVEIIMFYVLMSCVGLSCSYIFFIGIVGACYDHFKEDMDIAPYNTDPINIQILDKKGKPHPFTLQFKGLRINDLCKKGYLSIGATFITNGHIKKEESKS